MLRGGRPVLLALELAVRERLLDQQRALTDVSPFERKRLLRAEPRVGEHGDQRGVAMPALVEEVAPELLDVRGRKRVDGALACGRRLARDLDRVRCDALPLDGALEHALEHRHRLADRLGADTGVLEVGAEASEGLRLEVAQAVGEAHTHRG